MLTTTAPKGGHFTAVAPGQRPWRTNHDRQLVAPPPSNLPDAVDRKATQVRLDSAQDVHEVIARRFDTQVGHAYETRCHTTLTRAAGAMLTTDPVSCGACHRWAETTARVVQP